MQTTADIVRDRTQIAPLQLVACDSDDVTQHIADATIAVCNSNDASLLGCALPPTCIVQSVPDIEERTSRML